MQQSLVEKVTAYDISEIVSAFSVSNDVSLAVAEELGVELKRYLALRASYPTERLAMAGPVDDLWHYFILATHEYKDFCDEVGTFIHHRPRALDAAGASDRDAYARTLAMYEHVFGLSAPSEYWPSVAALVAVGADAECGRCT